MGIGYSKSLGLAALLIATVGLGCVAMIQTKFIQPSKSIWGGQYQSSVEADFIDHFPLSEISRDIWTAFQLVILDQTHNDVIRTTDNWLFTAEEFRQPNSDVSFDDELDSVSAQLQGSGTKLITIVVPDKARIYAEKLPHARMDSLEMRYDSVLNHLKDAQIQTLDLRPIFLDLKSHAAPYLRTDTHWSPLGSETIAREVASLLINSLDTHNIYRTTWSDPSPFNGDLMTFIETGFLSNLIDFPKESVSLALTEQVGGEMSLFDNFEIPVTLVGTSFSANPAFNFDGFLKQHLGVDVLNVAQIGSGPFEPMRDYLASDDFISAPPKIVIWEIPERYISTEETDR